MMKSGGLKHNLIRWRARLAILLAVSLTVVSGGCFESDEGELYFGQVRVPRQQEFRWSDGGLPRTFDPALAAAPPDTDAVRALFEGLTDYDPRTLAPVAGVAARWESSADGQAWTFHLRRDAHWSNGAPVTAQDFVRSWRRTLRLGDRAPHANLLANIVGATREPDALPVPSSTAAPAVAPASDSTAEAQSAGAQVSPSETAPEAERAAPAPAETAPAFGVEAVDEFTLRVRLQRPDRNFPALVAHPVFRPVPALGNEAEAANETEPFGPTLQTKSNEAQVPVVSNGAFRLARLSHDDVVLERAQSYWNASTVALERVHFVNMGDPEAALAAYRAGEVDAVTNANVEPLAVKLLAPYRDFHRATFGALTYYEFNASRPPFDDPRVRRALALAIDRARLSGDTLGGATEPAEKFLPKSAADAAQPESEAQVETKVHDEAKGQGDINAQDTAGAAPIGYDVARAQQLLAEAGYPAGAGFPRVRLLVNRNEQHRAVARAIAAMWRNGIGVETDIVLRNWDEYEEALRAGDYDVARRSIVMQTTDEETNMRALFPRAVLPAAPDDAPAAPQTAAAHAPDRAPAPGDGAVQGGSALPLLTEADALRQLPAIPVYFASSYALVKPYVTGFDANLLDAPSLQRVRIDTNWQPPPASAAPR